MDLITVTVVHKETGEILARAETHNWLHAEILEDRAHRQAELRQMEDQVEILFDVKADHRY